MVFLSKGNGSTRRNGKNKKVCIHIYINRLYDITHINEFKEKLFFFTREMVRACRFVHKVFDLLEEVSLAPFLTLVRHLNSNK